MPPFKAIKYFVEDRVAHVVLNRPKRYNAISLEMPSEIKSAVEMANLDDEVRVILLYGAGNAFCSGYDLKDFAEVDRDEGIMGSQKMPWDPYQDYRWMFMSTQCYMSLWNSLKPTVCKIHGYAVAGGSDIALCCDIVLMADTAKIGYPPARVWGCPTGAMWTFRLGPEKAKRMLFTGDLITGREAEKLGLVLESVPDHKLDNRVSELVNRIKTVPTNQLWYTKTVINTAVEAQGLATAQKMSTLFDGMSRHSPEGIAFQKRAFEAGFKQAVHERDTGTRDWSKPAAKL